MVNKTKLSEITELSSLLDADKNSAEGIDISNLFVNSSKTVNWKCIHGHTFTEKVGVMYRRKNKCFFCTGRQVWSGENDLQTLYPVLASEFDVVKNGITPDKISPRDTSKYWWACKNGHPGFQQSVEHRINRKTECPYCAGRIVLPEIDDLETLFPETAKEWDTEKNGGLSPKYVSAYTYKSYWWICPKGHSYKKKVINRTKFHKPVDCPKCTKAHSTSFPEQAIYYYSKKCFPDAVNRYKEPFDNGMELDIFIPSYNIGIEYDGAAFHNTEEQHERECRKYAACKQLGIKLFRIKESENTWGDTADRNFYIKKRMNDTELSACLQSIFSSIFFFRMHTFKSNDANESLNNLYYGFPTDFNISRDRPEILEYLTDIEHSFGAEYPRMAAMWSDEGNGSLTPFMFTSGSNFQPVWKCPECGKMWKSSIASIVSRNVQTCKNCSMKHAGKATTKTKTAKHGSLAERSDLLLRQWDYAANGELSPYEIPLNYSFSVAWKCDKCGYKWSSSPNSRARGSDCPHCTGRVAMPGVDDLQTLYPDAAKLWDYSKNGDILPTQIKPFSNKKYYWICPVCKNSYATRPGHVIEGHVCQKCAHARIGIMNSKKVGQFSDDGVLINTFSGLHQAAREMNVTPNSIFQAVKNGTKSKGFYWKYIVHEE